MMMTLQIRLDLGDFTFSLGSI